MTKKALMVHGGWEGHEPRRCVERFAPFLESQGFALEISGSLAVYQDAETIATDFDVPEAREIIQRGMLWAANVSV